MSPEDNSREPDCVFYRHTTVRHCTGQDAATKPDCMNCDGKGDKAELFGWDCYSPRGPSTYIQSGPEINGE